MVPDHLSVSKPRQPLEEGALGNGEEEHPDVGPQHDAECDASPADLQRGVEVGL